MRFGRIGAAAITIALVAQTTSAAAAVLVLRSTGPSAQRYRVGARLPDAGRIILRPGDSMTILFRGRTRNFRGPGNFSAMDPVQIAGGGPRRNATGTVRGPTSEVAPDVRLIDVRRSQTGCILPGGPVTLWRPAGSATQEVRLTNASSPATTIEWPRGEQQLQLPGPVGERSRIELPGRPTITITFALVRADARDPEALATALVDQRCFVQLEALTEQLAQ